MSSDRSKASRDVFSSTLGLMAIATVPVFACLIASAVATTAAHYSLRDGILLAAAYFLLALCLTHGAIALSRLLRRAHFRALARVSGIASAPLATVLVWHARECYRWPESRTSLAILITGSAAVLAPAVLWLDRRIHPRVAGLTATFAGVSLAVVMLIAFPTLNTFRWHILNHNTTLGAPLYYLLSAPVDDAISRAWRTSDGRSIRQSAPTRNRLASPTTTPPNIVFVLVDSLRADRLAAYGGREQTTPDVNRFAQNGLVFSNLNANASWTRASVASMFTGLLQEQHGAVDRDGTLVAGAGTLSERLRQAGYETAAFVTNYGAVGPAAGLDRGFQEFMTISSVDKAYASAEVVNERVQAWLAARAKSGRHQPLFLYIHYLDPHAPYEVAPPHSRRRDDLLASYDADVTYFDRQFRVLFDGLQELLVPQPTILFTSDHGEEFGEHDAWWHGTGLSPEQLHIPLIVSSPNVKPGTLHAALEGRDLFALTLYLAEGGTDLRGWASERNRRSRYSSIFLSSIASIFHPREVRVGMRSFSDGQHVLIWSAYGETFELYDLAKDPHRRVNIYEQQPPCLSSLARGLVHPSLDAVSTDPSGVLAVDPLTMESLRALGYAK